MINITVIAQLLEAEVVQVNEKLKEGFIAAGVSASSNLIQSFEVKTEVGNQFIFCSIIADEYWVWVDQGRGPTKNGPPAGQGVVKGKIKDWLQRRGINSSDLSQDELAYLISRKIHKEGFNGKFVVEKILNEIETGLMQRIDQIIDDNYDISSNISS